MTFENILQLAVLACIGVGVVGLIFPPMVFLPSRWSAAAILLFMLVPLGAAIEFYPVAGNDPADGATFGFAICWFLIVGAVARFRSLRRRAVNNPTAQPSAGIWAAIKSSWAEAKKAEQDRLAFKRAEGATGRASATPSVFMEVKYSPDVLRQGSGDDVLKFEYADADGVITIRTIRNWTDDGIYLRGWCVDRRATRTFRVDRVIGWL